jgi:hypothetical protein
MAIPDHLLNALMKDYKKDYKNPAIFNPTVSTVISSSFNLIIYAKTILN